MGINGMLLKMVDFWRNDFFHNHISVILVCFFCFLLTVQVLDMGDNKEKFSLEIDLFI